MPRSALFTREEIVRAGFDLVRRKGAESLSARELGKVLGSSSRPIFTVFKNMEEVRHEVREESKRWLGSYMADVTDYTPAFKEYGMRLIKLAKDEEHLFRFLFLDKDTPQDPIAPIVITCTDAMEKEYGITHEDVQILHYQCWIYTCGLAIQVNTGSVEYSEEQISELLARQFVSNLYFIKSGKKLPLVMPHLRGEDDITLKIDM